MSDNPYQIVKNFEETMAKYTGAPYAVAVESCTAAIFLCCKYLKVNEVTIPKRTYVSVPCSIIHAGGKVNFENLRWRGAYQLKPYPIWDSAKRLTSGMYTSGNYLCLSFHAKKLLPIGRGGMILTDNKDAVKWFKMARFDGRHEITLEEDHFDIIGWNCYMTPEQAARGLLLATFLPEHNEDPPEEEYNDLSQYKMYKKANRG